MTENTAETVAVAEAPAFELPELVAYRDRDGAVRPAIVLAAAFETAPAKLRVVRNSGRTYVRYATLDAETEQYVKIPADQVPGYVAPSDYDEDFDAEDTSDDPDADE